LKQIRISIRFRKEKFCLLSSMVISVIVRSIPEAIFPYPIGFDTPLYFVMGKRWVQQPLPFPLLIALIGTLYVMGVDLVLVMKFLPVLLYGLLGFASFIFARKYLIWDDFNSLLASLSLSLSIAMLRMSWDMHKLTLGIALMLLSLSFWKCMKDVKGKILFSILSLLTMISHEIIVVTYVIILAFFALRKSEGRILTLVILSAGILCFFGAWYSSRLENVFGWVSTIFMSAPFSGFTHELYASGFLIMKLYLLTLPISIIGLFRDDVTTIWTAFYLLGSLSTMLFPSFLLGGVLPWRYILLLTVPLSIYAAKGSSILSEKIKFGRKSLWALILILLVNFPSYPFLTALGVLETYKHEGIMPEHMAQTSIPLYDIEPTINLLSKVEGGALIVYGNFIGWAKYYTDAEVIGFGGTYGVAPSLKQALNLIENKTRVYLLFWNDAVAEELGFRILAIEGNLRLYEYVGDERDE